MNNKCIFKEKEYKCEIQGCILCNDFEKCIFCYNEYILIEGYCI